MNNEYEFKKNIVVEIENDSVYGVYTNINGIFCNKEINRRVDSWRKSLLPKDPTHYRTKRNENVNLKEVDKHNTKLKLKEDWFNKFIKKD